ncbi:MAG: hypothetical protein ABL889_21080 [Terricaulis sp.]
MAGDAASIASLRAHYSAPSLELDIPKFVDDFKKESDRALIVVMGSLLEDNLALAIKTKLRPMDAKEEKALRLYNHDGPIGTFSAKINMAYVLQIIEGATRDDLHDLREMRNACAHSMRPIDFMTPQLFEVQKRLFMPSRDTLWRSPTNESSHEDRRNLFILKALTLLITISHGSKEEADAFVTGYAQSIGDLGLVKE